jgi:uncharacterized membrane protein YdjX (TVP38/TMEM64 family)
LEPGGKSQGRAAAGEAGAANVPERKPWVRIAVGLVVLGVLVVVGRQLGGALPRFAAWVESLGAWGPVVFVLGYAVAVVAFVPGSLLTLAAGAIFGVLWGVVWVFIAAVLGSAAAFLIARYVARDAVARRLAANPRFAAVDRAVGREGRKIVFLLRLSPLFPFTLLNYALGLTTVRFADYLLAAVGMIPARSSTSTTGSSRATWPRSPAARRSSADRATGRCWRSASSPASSWRHSSAERRSGRSPRRSAREEATPVCRRARCVVRGRVRGDEWPRVIR